MVAAAAAAAAATAAVGLGGGWTCKKGLWGQYDLLNYVEYNLVRGVQ